MELNFTQDTIKQLLDEGKHDEVLGIFLSIEHAVEECRRKTSETEQLRMEFLATISHELRTPLNVIIGYNSLLEDGIYGELNEKQLRAVQRIDRNSTRLLTLVNQLLDLSRLEAGAVAVFYEPADVTQLVKEVLDDYQLVADEKGLRFEVTQPHGGCTIVTDGGKVREMIRQIISNAVKFSSNGTVKIILKPDGKGVSLEIADSGPGIPSELKEQVIDLFRQGDASYTRKHEGAGLGLAIVNRLSGLMNIYTEIESEAGKGTKIRLTIPCAKAQQDHLANQKVTAEINQNAVKEPAKLPIPSLNQSVLIVDDDPYTVELLADLLENHGQCIVEKAYSGMHAMIHLAKQKPDYLLVDLFMPQINGERVIQYCHELWGKDQVKIIIITGKTIDQNEMKKLLGISNAVITKGDLRPQTLLKTLQPYFQFTTKVSA